MKKRMKAIWTDFRSRGTPVLVIVWLLTQAADATQQQKLKLIEIHRQLELQMDVFSQTPPDAGADTSPEQILERLRAIESELTGEYVPICSRKLRQISNIAAMQGDYPAAIEYSARCVSMITRIYGSDHWRTSESRKIHQAVQAESQLLPAERQRLVHLLSIVGSCSRPASAAQMRDNVKKLVAVRAEMIRMVGRDHVLPGVVYATTFSLLMDLAEFQQARDLSLEQVELHAAHSLPGESLLQTARINLATAEHELGNDDQAYRALAAAEAVYENEEPSPGHEALWNTKAKILLHAGAFSGAQEAIDRYIQLMETRSPWNVRSLAVGKSSRGTILARAGDLNAAIPELQHAIQLAVDAKDPMTEARARLSLAEVLRDMHRYTESDSEMQQSLQIRVQHLSESHPDTIRCIKSIAVSQLRQRNLEAAAKLTDRAVQMLFSRKDEQANLYAELCHLQGIIQRRAGRSELSRQAFLEAENAAGGTRGSGLFSRFERLSLGAEEDDPAAFAEIEQVAEQLGRLLNPRETVLAFETLAFARLRRGESSAAFNALDVSRRALRVFQQVNLPGLSQSEQLSVVSAQRPLGRLGALIQLAHQEQKPELTERTLEWVLNDKGFVAEVLADVYQYNRTLISSGDRVLAEELQVIRGMFAQQLAAGETKQNPALVRLQRRADEISLRLGLAARSLILDRPWVTVSDLRRRIAPDTVLVEILRTSGGPSTSGQEKYFAWVVPPAQKGDVRLIDLGPAAAVDRLITEFRAQLLEMQNSADISTVNRTLRTRLNADVNRTTTQLSRLMLEAAVEQPGSSGTLLLPHLKNFRNWIISPDSVLWLFPWDVLALNAEGRLVAQEHVVSYLNTGRLLTRNRSETRSSDSVAVFDPDFGAGSHRPAYLAHLPRWSQLPGTAAQATASSTYMETLSGQHHRISGAQATEETVREACHSPSELFIATHGYSVLADVQASAEPDDSGTDHGFQPLQYCGLVMAGGNLLPEGAHDNYLSGEEIVQLDLVGSNVFCTACVSGLGLRQDGQGVASLNQAFQLAGAASLITTLWEVQQQSGTVPLIKEYWDQRGKGQSPAEALAHARRKVLSDPTTSHPYFWAGFTTSMAGDVEASELPQ